MATIKVISVQTLETIIQKIVSPQSIIEKIVKTKTESISQARK